MNLPWDLTTSVEALSEHNDGRVVVLYLDETMQHGENWLPTMNVDGDDGFYRFPTMARSTVATFFGSDYRAAKDLVVVVNKQLGVSPEKAREVMLGILRRGDFFGPPA